ncbi:MAG: DNA adenine methylase [Chloroflexi bacterium]|nr:DNA adenine methylase [Chloroflexota bacterium]
MKKLPSLTSRLANAPKPFLKWAGGKTQLLSQLQPLFPRQFSGYHEPFVGSAAVYFHLYNLIQSGELKASLKRVSLTDSNEELINCYRAVRDDVEAVIEILADHKENHSRRYYYAVRAERQPHQNNVERAARLIYLNKTCYNGLYRVNRKGLFNVPMGRYKNPGIFDPDELRAASRALDGVSIEVADFRDVLKRARKDDFVYFDPPYYPLSKTASFTSYTMQPFGKFEHESLALVARALDEKGCRVMVNNSWSDYTRRLYFGFKRVELKANRSINSKAAKRGKISEMVVVNK